MLAFAFMSWSSCALVAPTSEAPGFAPDGGPARSQALNASAAMNTLPFMRPQIYLITAVLPRLARFQDLVGSRAGQHLLGDEHLGTLSRAHLQRRDDARLHQRAVGESDHRSAIGAGVACLARLHRN